MSEGLFSTLFVPDAMAEATSDRAWLRAMLDVESALAAAEARAGVIPSEAAASIAAACEAGHFDAASLGHDARGSGNVVVPLVRALMAEVGDEGAGYVHWGATSQDVLDTAMMLVARRALDLVVADLDAIAAVCARLARAHRSTLMVGRTLLQQALPVTFGLKVAGWLVSVIEARRLLLQSRSQLAVQLGGGAGTLAALGSEGVAVMGFLAEELQLREPPLPWHTLRARVANLGASLGIAAGALSKLALDVALLSQTEVGEVAEPSGGGRGGSSTMPHKQNPVGATLALACARRVQGLAAVLMGSMPQEHERAVGAWHAEWEALRDALAYTGGAAAWMRGALEGLDVRPDRMRANLGLTGGLLLAERVTMLLAARIGRRAAHDLVEAACERAVHKRRSLLDELSGDAGVLAELSPREIEEALQPESYLGSADAFVERALDFYRREAGVSGSG